MTANVSLTFVPEAIRVEEQRIAVDDEAALAQALVSIPYPDSVRGLLGKEFFGRRWQQEECCDYWLASDGDTVVWLKIRGATATQVADIRFRFDVIVDQYPGTRPSKSLICDFVNAVTGARADESG